MKEEKKIYTDDWNTTENRMIIKIHQHIMLTEKGKLGEFLKGCHRY